MGWWDPASAWRSAELAPPSSPSPSPRWLRRYLNSFEAHPDDMEATTLDPACPVGNSFKYREAGQRLGSVWLCSKILGNTQYCGDWPATDLSVLKVRCWVK